MASIQDVVVSELVKMVLNQLGSAAFSEIGRIFRVKGELKRLENTMVAINAVLLDAEEQQFTNNSVRIWLLNLKDVVYDIEDLLDLISTEELECKVKRTILGSKITKLLSCYKFAQELKTIHRKLNEIAENRRNYSFQDNRALTPIAVIAEEQRETCSLILESHTFGREEEKEWIISHLLKSSSDDAQNVSVIPITGIGGMGKTTLAQLVFNDSRVVQNFSLRLWVYVSKKFLLKSVIAKILESATGQDFSNLSMEVLQKKLHSVLADSTFLLVLDDMWNEDSKQWIELKKLLIVGQRSAILVTTREEKVAVVTGTTKPYKLKDLPEYHCWSIFVKHAFDEGEEEKYPLLVKIGKSIVRKCGGVPLAVKTLGSLLRDKRDDRTWKRIAENKLWEIYQRENDILPVLKLSLDHTPYQLRSCFTFCSLFGKGYPFYRTDIINMWMALGFLQVQREDALDVGNRYFDELLSRSFLQLPCAESHVLRMMKAYNYMQGGINLLQMSYEDAISQAFRSLDGKVTSTEMHDVVHDLAAYVAGDEIATVSSNVHNISPRVKHLMMDAENLSDDFNGILKARKARSFASTGSISKLFLERLISSFKHLRVLLLLYSGIEELPDSIGNLKHLRYLNLSTNTQLKLLPNSICKLVNLQVLHLEYCSKLEMLPGDVYNLASLRILVLTLKITCFPERSFQGWSSLQVLKFTFCLNLELLPEAMGSLKSLRILVIRVCSKLASLPNSMRNLTNLEHLTIHSCEKLDLTGWKGLHGLKSLKFLLIFGLPKLLDFPDGIDSAAGSMQYFRINECMGLRSLPEGLIQCTSLLKLQIFNCPNLSFLPRGFDNLKDLQELRIFGCPELSYRCKSGGDDWHLISHVPEIYIDETVIRTRHAGDRKFSNHTFLLFSSTIIERGPQNRHGPYPSRLLHVIHPLFAYFHGFGNKDDDMENSVCLAHAL